MIKRTGYINEMGVFPNPGRPQKIMWCVDHGPDRSHLFDVDWFYRLRDARRFASTLIPTPFGPRPYKITRWEWRPDPMVPHREIASTDLVETNIERPMGGEYEI